MREACELPRGCASPSTVSKPCLSASQEEPVGLLTRARVFLLRAIPQCPMRSFSNVTEVTAALGLPTPVGHL